jgi:hypothetical protein
MTGAATRVVICDDDGERARWWANKIRAIPGLPGHIDVQPLETSDFALALEALAQRREAARVDEPFEPGEGEARLIDDADILIVDFDLTPRADVLEASVEDEGQRDATRDKLRGRSGEQVAYLARCYSTAGFIVVVNQEYQRRTFDLTMQRFVHSYAELNVTHYDVTMAGLWLASTGQDVFRPWAWPRLCEASDLQMRRVAAVPSLDAPVLSSLGITGSDRRAMTARQLDPLGDEPDKTTFDDVVDGSDLGLQVKDVQKDPDQRRRIAAAAIGRWLETVVLPAQNVIVDAPHVAHRFPQLLGARAGEVDAWQEIAALDAKPDSLQGIPSACPSWLSRPAWSASAVREEMARMEAPTNRPADVVFCEDVSRFVTIADATEFETDLPGPYDQRFVRDLDGIDYHPRPRLLS